MSRRQRSNTILGLLLILAGAAFLAQQFYPNLRIWEYFTFSWPWYVIGAGVLLLLLGLLVGAPGMAVPAAIVAGIGGLLYWQNATGNWDSWAYTWTLIPGFVGIGIILEALLEGKLRSGLRAGGGLVVISAILFVIFASFLGGPALLGTYWPVLLILIGLWFIIRSLLRRG
jgi:hypothetical protein